MNKQAKLGFYQQEGGRRLWNEQLALESDVSYVIHAESSMQWSVLKSINILDISQYFNIDFK